MPKLPLVRHQQMIKILKTLGFVERDAEGSHIFFRHADGRTTVISAKNREMSRGLLRKVLNDIDLSIEEYKKLRRKI